MPIIKKEYNKMYLIAILPQTISLSFYFCTYLIQAKTGDAENAAFILTDGVYHKTVITCTVTRLTYNRAQTVWVDARAVAATAAAAVVAALVITAGAARYAAFVVFTRQTVGTCAATQLAAAAVAYRSAGRPELEAGLRNAAVAAVTLLTLVAARAGAFGKRAVALVCRGVAGGELAAVVYIEAFDALLCRRGASGQGGVGAVRVV